MPFVIIQPREPAGRGRRAADDMHDDVDAAELGADRIGDRRASLGLS
jgi:hypothetical protein